MPGSWQPRQRGPRRRPWRTTAGMPRYRFANAFEGCSSEESGQEARLAGHRRAIVGIGEEHALLRGEPLRQDSDVGNGSRGRGDPGRVNERQSQHLRKNRRVVRMPNVAKRPGSHHAEARGIHHLNVPVLAERTNDPPAHGIGRQENGKHRRSEPQNERTPKEDDLHRGANQHRGVQKHHPAKFWLIHFRRAKRGHFPLMPLGDAQLDQPQQRHGEEQTEKRDDTQVHCNSKNSALKPGPNAAASAYSPGCSGLFSSHSCRMKRIVALDRFPTFPRMSQDGCVSHLHKPSSVSMFPSSRAPPGCRIQPLISSRFRPLRSRKPCTNPAIFPPIISGTSFASRMWNPESRRSNPMAPSESGNVYVSEARIFGPRICFPLTTTAAAPSPNRTAEIRLACEMSLRCNVSVGSSTAMIRTFPPGSAFK